MPDKEKVIAVSCEIEYENHSEKVRHVVNHDYTDYVELAGATPMIVPIGIRPSVAVEMFDGLLLTGGKDITPTVYGRDIRGAKKCSRQRDNHELGLLRAFHKAKKPVFGICRGFQLIGVYFGLPMHQEIHKDNDVTILHNQRAAEIPGITPVHKINLEKGISKALGGKTQISVNSFHHQGFLWGQCGGKLQELDIDGIATSRDKEKVIEGLLLEGGRIGGVQYHPERMVVNSKSLHLKLFKYVMNIA